MAWWDHDDLRDVRYKRGLLDRAGQHQEKQMTDIKEVPDDWKPGDMRMSEKGDFETWVPSLGWIPACENQYSIGMWQTRTFGPLRSFLTQTVRANLEMAELLRAAEALDQFNRAHPTTGLLNEELSRKRATLQAAVAEETADVMIVLMGNLCALGVDMKTEITRKMQVNRKRKWVLNGDGTGQHVREKPVHRVSDEPASGERYA